MMPDVQAQEKRVDWSAQQVSEAVPIRHPDHPASMCGTLHILNTESGQAALSEYRRLKAAGLLPVAKRTAVYTVGDTASFKVRASAGTSEWVTKDFILKVEDPTLNIWVSIKQLNAGTVTDASLEILRQHLAESTPTTSINPNQGSFQNDEDVFGEPPNVDGDGKVDVLVFDINDDNDGILGYVDPIDLISNPNSNGADIVYLDHTGFRRVGTFSIEPNAAHEYQHLIGFNYDFNETAFVLEGLAEWAQSLSGYPARTPDYLSFDPVPYNVPMFRFDRDNFANQINDYERASLFMGYLGQRIGLEAGGALARNTGAGLVGIRSVLNEFNMPFLIEDIIFDFHTANLVNDRNINTNFGYENQQRMQELNFTPNTIFEGASRSETLLIDLRLLPGGVDYLVWHNVQDLEIDIDVVAADALRNEFRNRTGVRVRLIRTDGTREVVDLNLSNGGFLFEGAYDEVALVLVHKRPDAPDIVLQYASRWSGGTGRQFVTQQYDNGCINSTAANTCAINQNEPPVIFNLSAGAEGAHATRFTVPEDGVLWTVSLSNYYRSMFTDGNGNPLQPTTAPRNFTLKIWADNGDGEPGEELFSQDFDDPRTHSFAVATYDHFDINMSPFIQDIGPLPEEIYIGIKESGEDENYMLVAPSDYPAESVSFVTTQRTGQIGWIPLWEVQFVGGDPEDFPVEGMAMATRAQFVIDPSLVPTAAEDEPELPRQVSLNQNYPNPFNPTTSITYSLPAGMQVQLSVYDVTGRQIAVLAEGIQPAGTHQVTFDAADWASGLYIYTLETESTRLSHKMMLLK
jgi:hypothetical protein